ncbi:OPA3 family protein [Micromonospora chersina]|uniref:hypothetical protein n=1 Tax=Micromonospora chersina TaxID=47854 RepID=UPI00371A6992
MAGRPFWVGTHHCLSFGRPTAIITVELVTIHATDTELAIACDDGTRIVRRTTDQPVRNLCCGLPDPCSVAAVAQSSHRFDVRLSRRSYGQLTLID